MGRNRRKAESDGVADTTINVTLGLLFTHHLPSVVIPSKAKEIQVRLSKRAEKASEKYVGEKVCTACLSC